MKYSQLLLLVGGVTIAYAKAAPNTANQAGQVVARDASQPAAVGGILPPREIHMVAERDPMLGTGGGKGKEQSKGKGKAQSQSKGKGKEQSKGKGKEQSKGKGKEQSKGKGKEQSKGKGKEQGGATGEIHRGVRGAVKNGA
ncbi:hypothetical protein MFIFM68171_07009 [Madurella fahalii]|uniref:Uncharacterized protein n=1 Tax=Madurella fahalii TaxID=1157608 RepID=A0ABQ0GGJ3_9PEZI